MGTGQPICKICIWVLGAFQPHKDENKTSQVQIHRFILFMQGYVFVKQRFLFAHPYSLGANSYESGWLLLHIGALCHTHRDDSYPYLLGSRQFSLLSIKKSSIINVLQCCATLPYNVTLTFRVQSLRLSEKRLKSYVSDDTKVRVGE